jgi:two-component system sensor histidine kinase KdpD
VDRVRLAADLEASRREAERARLRSALLTSVSHDLRTPLASIVGAASTVQELGGSLAEADRAELLETVIGEARRLNGYIQNLLDMTRIEHGELRIHRDWEEPSDLIGAAIRLARENWPDAPITSRIAPGVGLAFVHGELLVQALHNVLDNAIRYSPPGTPVEIACTQNGHGLQIEISDSGPGLSEDQRLRMFDMFYRAESLDSRSGGTGLGLTITCGIVEAHGGKVTATAGREASGMRIVVLLPDMTLGDLPGQVSQ